MPVSKLKRVKLSALKVSVANMLEALGYDLTNHDLKDTPTRVAKTLYRELMPDKKVKKLFATFPSEYESMIILKNHKTYTRCPHHLERVILKVDVGYIPDGRLIGLSKLARIADYFSKGLMLQEEIAEGIALGLMNALKPKGVAVFIEGYHMCMQARGVETNGSVVTSKFLGVFLEDSYKGLAARTEFLTLIKRGER